MPLKPKFHSYDRRGLVFDLNEVTVERPRAWLDQSLGCWVVAICRLSDHGAAVFLADAAEPAPGWDYYQNMPPLASIPPGLKFEMDIIDFEGERGCLELQHHLPNGDVNSLN